jgi:CBS domain-containing protein
MSKSRSPTSKSNRRVNATETATARIKEPPMPMIGEISTPHHIEVSRDASVSEAAELMRTYEIGDLIVNDDNGSAVGILTDHDVAVRVVAEHRDPATTKAGDICTNEIVTLEATEEIESAARLMAEHALRRLPLVDSTGRPVGIVTIGDLAMSVHVDDGEIRDVVRAAETEQRRKVAG